MPRNLALAFAELLVGGIVLEAALKDSSLGDVVKGQASSSSGTGVASTASGTTSSTGSGTVTLGTLGLTAGNGVSSSAVETAETAPPAVGKALNRAESLIGAPYSQANHAGAFDQVAAAVKKAGIDCSGLVGTVLGPLGAGVLTSPETTQTIPGTKGIVSGVGQYITIYDRSTGAADMDHTIIDIAGQFFESGGNSSYNPNGKVAALTSVQAKGELAGGGFATYHPTGL